MPFLLKVAWRYLTSSRLQTGLLVAGVGIGVIVFVFITALILGLRAYVTDRVIGSLPHITIEAAKRVPRLLPWDGLDGATLLVAREPAAEIRRQLRHWRPIMAALEVDPRVAAVSPQITGTLLIRRGQGSTAASVQGVMPDRLDAISNISGNVVDGVARVDQDGILVGHRLAEKLDLKAQDTVSVRSERGVERTFKINGLYDTGVDSLDERVVYTSLDAARRLFDMPFGVDKLEVKLEDYRIARPMAAELRTAWKSDVTSWNERNERIEDALRSQASTGTVIKGFSLLLTIVGVSSALLLTTFRRRPEIGIMRAMGVSRRFIVGVFILQGILVGLTGSSMGAAVGWAFCEGLSLLRHPDGRPLLPIDPALGGYPEAVLLTTAAAALAALLPARAASRVDPVQVIVNA